MDDLEVERRRALEHEFWRTSPTESPDSTSIENVINKARDAAVLLDLRHRFRPYFEQAQTILEVGGGQGWGACLVKRLFPHACVTTTDLSADAVASVPKWEHFFEVKLDGAKACPSDALSQPDESQDVIFCFAAAHHFVTHARTLREIRRVLRQRGHGLYFYEPSCPNYLYTAAIRRVERKRPDVPEDVLRYADIAKVARSTGLECDVQFYPSVLRRGPVETLYYALLGRSKVLQRVLPCTANYVFTKA
jgi:ubiquinone/menaquinone biosynthesis C-methylase UbiE